MAKVAAAPIVARVDAIRIVWEADTEPPPPFERQSEDGEYYSCHAVAEVSYPCGSAGERRIEYLRSGGLYGIEDPSPEYQRQIEDEEIADLRGHLAVFRVEVPRVLVIEGRTRC